MSRIKQGALGLAGLMLVLLAGLSPAAAAPMEAMDPSVAAGVERQRVVTKVIDFTKGEHLTQPKVARPSLVYCTPSNHPVGCLPYEPTMSWTTTGCDGDAFVLTMTYVNEMRREVPVDTTNGDFTETAFVPAAVPAGPGVYNLTFRLLPSQLQLVTGSWMGVIFSRLSLRNTTPLCP